MDKLKPFAIPLVALALLLIWYLFVSPRLTQEPASDSKQTEARDSAK